MQTKLTFIGAGNMATSIIGGLIQEGFAANNISASDPNKASLDTLSADFGINTTSDNLTACASADIIVLAVKPQILRSVAASLKGHLPKGCLVVSIAAGITSGQLQQWLGETQAIVRCMPNTPALVKQGASGLYANQQVSEAQKAQVTELLSSIGISRWVEQESLIDVVTAASGSGPAYFFLLMEAMINSSIEQGLDPETAKSLVLQTALGAATLATSSDCDVDELRKRVTSPKGTTESAINSFQANGFSHTVDQAMRAAQARSVAMSEELNN